MGFWNLNSGLGKFFHVTSTGASVVNYVQPRLSLWANIFVWNMMRMTRAGSSTEVDKLFVHVYKVTCFTARTFRRIYILTVVLLGCVVSRPVIGWRLPHSSCTRITDGCGVGHRDIWQLLCFTCIQAITADTVIAYIVSFNVLIVSMILSLYSVCMHFILY